MEGAKSKYARGEPRDLEQIVAPRRGLQHNLVDDHWAKNLVNLNSQLRLASRKHRSHASSLAKRLRRGFPAPRVCGIAGILRFDGELPSVEALIGMSQSLHHRGPDDAGVEVHGPCGLAHRRLSIIDLSPSGHQPMSTADRQLWLSYNGEVYNYLELRAELEKAGHLFRTRTDSEVILAAYRQWGEEAFSRFNGMWALAIWDVAGQQLILSRDRLGVKPLCLHRNDRRLMFASEVKALLQAEPALAEANLSAIARFLVEAGSSFGRDTFFDRVERLEPGTLLICDKAGKARSSRYWRFRPPSSPRGVSLERAAGELSEILVDAVRLRFRSDVPVGTCLSGGLDSSSIVGISARRLSLRPECFSAIYPDPGYDEGHFVELARKELSLPGHEARPTGEDLAQVLERATYFGEQPSAGPGVYSQWQVMALASGRVRVLLDGQGGDELYAGYFADFLAFGRSLLRRGLEGHPRALWELLRSEPEIRKLARLSPIGNLTRPARARLRRFFGRAPAPGAPSILPAHLEQLLGNASAPVPEQVSGDPLTDLLWDQLVRSSIPGLLHYEDRSSMAFSIEARVPFLDYRLVEHAFSLPSELKIHRAETKRVLRRAAQAWVPPAIIERRDKKGYPTPMARWIRQGHHELIDDLLLSSRATKRELLAPGAAARILQEHRRGSKDHSWRIWQLATLELFFRRFLDGALALEPPQSSAREREAQAHLGGAPPVASA